MRTGFTLRHALPRRPAAYGDAASLTTTPSWPARERLVEHALRLAGSEVSDAGISSCGAIASQPRARARSSGVSSRSSPSRCSRSKRNVTIPSGGASRVDLRDRVLERGRARRRPSRSPRRRAPPAATGSARTASTIPGSARGDLVEVARVDRAPRRRGDGSGCGCRRASTRPTRARSPRPPRPRSRRSRRASAGSAGRARSRPSRRPSSPLAERDLRRAREVAREHERAPRERRPGTPAAFATASTISPASAPCRSSPVKSRRRKSASSSVARPSSSASSCLRRGRRAAARSRAWISRDRARRASPTVERRLGRRRALDAVHRRVADADAALPRHAGEEAGDDRHLVRARAARSSSASSAIFARARARLARRGARPRRRRRAASRRSASVVATSSSRS